MAQLWQVPEVTDWWLPNEEGLTPLMREIRAFGKERMTSELDETTRKIRDISAIFSGLEAQPEVSAQPEVPAQLQVSAPT